MPRQFKLIFTSDHDHLFCKSFAIIYGFMDELFVCAIKHPNFQKVFMYKKSYCFDIFGWNV